MWIPISSLGPVASIVLMSVVGCRGCEAAVVDEDAGTRPSEGEGEGEGEGETIDAGHGFDLENLLDGGLPDELSCLPTDLPSLSVGGALDLLGFSPYFDRPERGVRCGDVVCDVDVPCCALCGFAACAGTDDAGVTDCPAFTTRYACDGDEECDGSEVCCFSLSGSACRPAADCDFDIGAALDNFLVDGGVRLSLPDAGIVDGGFLDGGFDVDGVALDGGTGPVPDAGSLLDGLQEALDQGLPVCTGSLFPPDCELLQGELCCTSDRLASVDIGFCLPAPLCAAGLLP